MSKYKVGDKFVIEISEKYTNDADDFVIEDELLYRVKGFKSLVFDSYGLDKLQKYEDTDYVEGVRAGLNSFDCEVKKAYYKGLQDAWELARKIADISTTKERADMFGYCCDGITITDILRDYTPQQVLAKIKDYEESKAIKVGDVVYADDEPDSFGVVTWKYNNEVYVMWDDGSCGDETNIEELHKTGRTVDIEHLLEQIRSDE